MACRPRPKKWPRKSVLTLNPHYDNLLNDSGRQELSRTVKYLVRAIAQYLELDYTSVPPYSMHIRPKKLGAFVRTSIVGPLIPSPFIFERHNEMPRTLIEAYLCSLSSCWEAIDQIKSSGNEHVADSYLRAIGLLLSRGMFTVGTVLMQKDVTKKLLEYHSMGPELTTKYIRKTIFQQKGGGYKIIPGMSPHVRILVTRFLRIFKRGMSCRGLSMDMDRNRMSFMDSLERLLRWELLSKYNIVGVGNPASTVLSDLLCYCGWDEDAPCREMCATILDSDSVFLRKHNNFIYRTAAEARLDQVQIGAVLDMDLSPIQDEMEKVLF